MGFLLLQFTGRAVAYQLGCIAHFVHDGVTGINTGGATNALILQAVANIDTRRANLDADTAIDAVTESFGRVITVFASLAPRFTTTVVVGNDQRVVIKHHALEPGVRAHIDAHLFAQITGIAISGQSKKAQPEHAPWGDVKGDNIDNQLTNRDKVADKGQGGEKSDTQPEQMLGRFAYQLGPGHGLAIQLHALMSLSFGDSINPDKHPAEHALRAGIATPDTPGKCGQGKQAKSADDQQPAQ